MAQCSGRMAVAAAQQEEQTGAGCLVFDLIPGHMAKRVVEPEGSLTKDED